MYKKSDYPDIKKYVLWLIETGRATGNHYDYVGDNLVDIVIDKTYNVGDSVQKRYEEIGSDVWVYYKLITNRNGYRRSYGNDQCMINNREFQEWTRDNKLNSILND